jgi:hypothetical protein
MPSYLDEEGPGAAGATAEAAPPEQPQEGGEEQQKEDAGQDQTALLPKAIFPHEPEIGDKCSFEVVAKHDEEISVRYSQEPEEGQEPEGGSEPPAPPPQPGGMGGMLD